MEQSVQVRELPIAATQIIETAGFTAVPASRRLAYATHVDYQ